MSVYKDAGHCIARVMSIETNTCTAQSAWQKLYDAGLPKVLGASSGLSAEERLTQDAMTRALLRRDLPKVQWHALVAKYSINNHEVADSVRWLIREVATPAHHLFKMKAVTAWAIPRRLPDAFYTLHSWDNDGTPDYTLRRWRRNLFKWLDDQVNRAHITVDTILEEHKLMIDDAS